jgi:hypothetical protein
MPITTWIQEHEIKGLSSVKDEALNELFQEVRQATNNRYLLSETVYQDRGWFGKRNERTVYTLYIHTSGTEYQVLNFAMEYGRCGINTSGTRALVMNYFFGVLGGIQFATSFKQQS